MIYYNYSGKELEIEEENDTCAIKQDGDTFYVKEYRGELFNPVGTDSRKILVTKWRRSSERCATLYRRFLETKAEHLLRRAERELLDV
jgi:hypothetical protein